MVDDDPDDVSLFQTALREIQFTSPVELITAEKGSVLFNTLNAWLRDNHPPPDLILLDLNLPIIDSITVLRNLKSDFRFRPIPVIALTTSSDKANIDSCYDIGVNAFITKPDSFEEIVAMVSSILNFWCRNVKLPGWGPHRGI